MWTYWIECGIWNMFYICNVFWQNKTQTISLTGTYTYTNKKNKSQYLLCGTSSLLCLHRSSLLQINKVRWTNSNLCINMYAGIVGIQPYLTCISFIHIELNLRSLLRDCSFTTITLFYNECHLWNTSWCKYLTFEPFSEVYILPLGHFLRYISYLWTIFWSIYLTFESFSQVHLTFEPFSEVYILHLSHFLRYILHLSHFLRYISYIWAIFWGIYISPLRHFLRHISYLFFWGICLTFGPFSEVYILPLSHLLRYISYLWAICWGIYLTFEPWFSEVDILHLSHFLRYISYLWAIFWGIYLTFEPFSEVYILHLRHFLRYISHLWVIF